LHGHTFVDAGDVPVEFVIKDGVPILLNTRSSVAISVADDHEPQSYTARLFADLAESREWELLREHAERNLDSSDETLARQARRMLALSLGHSETAADKEAAVEQYRLLIDTGASEPTDLGNLAGLLIDAGDFDSAKVAVLDGIGKFPSR
jgi:uncharacterized protein (DUF924 family)